MLAILSGVLLIAALITSTALVILRALTRAEDAADAVAGGCPCPDWFESSNRSSPVTGTGAIVRACGMRGGRNGRRLNHQSCGPRRWELHVYYT